MFKVNYKKIKEKLITDRAKRAVKISGIVFSIAFISILLSAMAVNSVLNRIIHIRSEVVIPDIEGMELNQALDLLAESNLSLMKVAEKYDATIPSGSIISQTPPPGLSVREGKAVEAVISSGGQVVFVPELTGMSLRQAELMLRQANLGMGSQVRTFSSTVRREHVVSQSPAAGRIVDRDTYINIVVSRGRDELEEVMSMVNLIGLNVRRVDSMIEPLGLELADIIGIEDDTRAEGTVVDQTPEPGDEVTAGAKVVITVSHRPRPIRVVKDALIDYEHPEEADEVQLRISIFDDIGERIVYDKLTPGGTLINIPVKILGEANYTVFHGEEDIEEEIFPEKVFTAPLIALEDLKEDEYDPEEEYQIPREEDYEYRHLGDTIPHNPDFPIIIDEE